MTDLILRPGRERSLARRHPWLYDGAIAAVHGRVEPGGTVAVRAADGRFLAWAAYNPQARLAARVWSWREEERVDADLIARRLETAIAYRDRLGLDSDALRLVYGEADGLPGVVVDRYAGVLVLQLTTAGAEAWRDVLVEGLAAHFPTAAIYERSDAEVRALEGLPPRTGPIRGRMPETVTIREAGLKFRVDVVRGHKTGFYLDQRDNRRIVAAHAAGCRVLECFAYTGAFGVHALAAGARSLLSIDSSAEALAQAREHVRLNDLDEGRCEWRTADVFQALRRLREEGRRFDLIVLDPPKFAPTHQHVERAARGYKDVNLNAMQLLAAGGVLATFSCSGGVDAALFRKIVAAAAWDAGVSLRVRAQLTQAADHPVLLAHPEGEYLKGLLLQRLD